MTPNKLSNLVYNAPNNAYEDEEQPNQNYR